MTSESYSAPWWLPGGHLQTLYAALAVRRPRVAYRRERWDTPDGDFVDVDWTADGAPADASRNRDRPLVVLFHGLEGCSRSHYAGALMQEVLHRGWRGAVIHFRGCSGNENLLPRAYHSGDTEEIDWMLRRMRDLAGRPVYAMGVSLGGNALLKWLGQRGERAREVVRATAAVSAPVDLAAAGDALGQGFNRVYTAAFLRTLRRKSLLKLERHPGIYLAEDVRRARTLRAFDNVVTAPLHGFRDTDDYWSRASSKPWLGSIAVPTLMINARNDPFMPPSALPSAGELSNAVTAEFPPTGGHVGFVTSPFPGALDWLPRRVVRFFRAADE